MDNQPVKWREVLSERAQEIDDTILSAYARGASADEAFDEVRNFAQGALGAPPEVCGPGSAFEGECRDIFQEHAARLENSGLLKPAVDAATVEQTRDYSGANQRSAAAGGAGPRGAGISGETGLPDQWGHQGTATNSQSSDYFRPGEETPVETGEDRQRHSDDG